MNLERDTRVTSAIRSTGSRPPTHSSGAQRLRSSGDDDQLQSVQKTRLCHTQAFKEMNAAFGHLYFYTRGNLCWMYRTVCTPCCILLKDNNSFKVDVKNHVKLKMDTRCTFSWAHYIIYRLSSKTSPLRLCLF